MEWMEWTEWLNSVINLRSDVLEKLLLSALALILLYSLRFFALKIIFRRIDDEEYESRYFWKKGVKNVYVVLLVIILAFIWFDKIGSLATFFGLVSAGIAIALQDPLVNLAGWLFIVVRKPLKLGDRIQINDISGDVIDVRFFQFTVNEIKNWVDAEQSTGRIIHIPNGYVFKHPQANYSQGFPHIWNEIGVLVTFESNWKKAETLLVEIVNEHAEKLSISAKKKLLEASKQFMIFYRTLTPTVYVSVKDSGVMLTMRFLVQPRKRRSSEDLIWRDVLDAFSKHEDIDFAYPTQRLYYNLQEGKKGTTKGPNYSDTDFQ
jgi:small-conductance mechanosensitive channel